MSFYPIPFGHVEVREDRRPVRPTRRSQEGRRRR